MSDVIIVGAGAAGVAAAMGASEAGERPIVMDVGIDVDRPDFRVEENLYAHATAHDRFDLMIGEAGEGLSNLLGETDVPVKLTAPGAAWVTRGASALAPVEERDFSAVQSFARGGLANAWGAGLYRFTDDDLTGFPISQYELDPHFDRLTEEIGIGGEADDLAPFFGSTKGLMQPLRLSRNIGDVYRRYRNLRSRPESFYIGRARVAALTEERDGRPAYAYHSTDFFQEDRSLYSPRYTLERLAAEHRIDYRPGVLVGRYREVDDGIEVHAHDLQTDARRVFHCRRLVLAAGAINTSRIVLASNEDYETELPLLENPALQFPLVLPAALGRRLDTEAFGLVQLNLVWDAKTYGQRLQGSIMEITAPARAEFFDGFPFAARDNIALIRNMLPAMIVMQLFFPGDAQPPAKLSLTPEGQLRIEGHPNRIDTKGLRPLLRFLMRLGCVTVPSMIVRVPTGHAVHYACTLPMKRSPGRYQCDADGRLGGSGNVFIADSAAFSRLPAKNMSFAMMANAMRVAERVAKGVRS